MTAEEREELRQRLERSRRELTETGEMSRQSARGGRVDKCALGRVARMDLLQAREMAVETERRRQTKLTAVEAALKRIESGDFGRCLDCDRDIGLPRLRFDPTARYCINCAARQDQ